MPRYCYMGNDKAGSGSSGLEKHEVDERFPIKVRYFDAKDHGEAYDEAVRSSINLDQDGCYVFACDEQNKIIGQIVMYVPVSPPEGYILRGQD